MISSTTNKQVKFVNALVKKAKTRREEELFVAEGLRMCSEIPKDRIHTLYISEAFSKTKECKVLREGVKHIELVTDEVFKKSVRYPVTSGNPGACKTVSLYAG